MGPYAGIVYNITSSRVDSKTCTMGNPMPESSQSTSALCQESTFPQSGTMDLATEKAECKDFSPIFGIGTPSIPTRRRVCPPPPFGSVGRGLLAGERGGRRVPVHLCTLWIYPMLRNSAEPQVCLSLLRSNSLKIQP
jgi:hypothetical protein